MKDHELKQDAMKMLRIFPLFFLLGFIPDLAITYAIVLYLGSSAPSFWIVFLTIWGLRCLGWIYKSTTSWLMFFLYSKEAMANGYLRQFKTYKFPGRHRTLFGMFASDYLWGVSNDDLIPIETRLKAREMYGYTGMVRQQGWRMSNQQDAALTLALKRYESGS